MQPRYVRLSRTRPRNGDQRRAPQGRAYSCSTRRPAAPKGLSRSPKGCGAAKPKARLDANSACAACRPRPACAARSRSRAKRGDLSEARRAERALLPRAASDDAPSRQPSATSNRQPKGLPKLSSATKPQKTKLRRTPQNNSPRAGKSIRGSIFHCACCVTQKTKLRRHYDRYNGQTRQLPI